MPGAPGTALFVVSGGLAIAGQLKIAAWFKARWSPGTCLAAGMSLMALAVVAPGVAARTGPVLAAFALVLAAGVLALGTVAVFPFEMDTVVRFAGGRLVATYYGFYNTAVGIGILAGTCSPAPYSTSPVQRGGRRIVTATAA